MSFDMSIDVECYWKSQIGGELDELARKMLNREGLKRTHKLSTDEKVHEYIKTNGFKYLPEIDEKTEFEKAYDL